MIIWNYAIGSNGVIDQKKALVPPTFIFNIYFLYIWQLCLYLSIHNGNYMQLFFEL